ncbi:MAG: L-histidine N(alpha)-methyltransferase [Sciscionella sp.]
MTESVAKSPTIDVQLTATQTAQALRDDVAEGLSGTPKTLPPKWFYDALGSEIFERITKLDEYYPTRAEAEILTAHARDIATRSRAAALVELGSGSSEKTRELLDALQRQGSLHDFVPLDVSESALREAADRIAAEYPGLRVQGLVGDFTQHLSVLPGLPPRLVVFLGGTIGNLAPGQRHEFLASVRAMLQPGEWLLLGTDLVKDRAVLERAYDDEEGVTAEFNRNVLRVINRELSANFELEQFEHRSVFNTEHSRIEMRLRARKPMTVRVAALDMTVDFADGEELLTEISTKFRREGITEELVLAGFALEDWWTDSEQRYAVSLSRASS